jgi:phage terminase small subunit
VPGESETIPTGEGKPKKGKPRGSRPKPGDKMGAAKMSAEERKQAAHAMRRKAFALAYLKCWNALDACEAAGLKRDRQNSYRYLRDLEVQAIIAEEMQKRCGEAQVSVARVVAELAAVAFPSMSDYAEWDDDGVKLIPSKDLTRDMCRAIQSIKVTHTQYGPNVSVKLHDKLKALEQLGRTLGMFQNEEGKDKLQPLEIMKMLQEFQKSTKDLATEDARTVDGGKETGNG